MLHTLLFLFFVLLVVFFIYDSIKPEYFPPGPRWLPLVGCLPRFWILRKKCGYIHEAIKELSDIYGPVLGLKLGKQKLIVISGHDLVKKVLLQEEFNGRPDGFFFRLRAFEKRRGVLFTDGPAWYEMRKFTMKHFRNFGLGQTTMINRVTVEAENLVKELQKQCKNGPILMHRVFDVAIINSLWIMFAGHGFEYGDKKMKDILDTVHTAFRVMDTMGGLVSQMPFLRFLIPELSGYNELVRIHEKFWAFIDEEITNHDMKLDINLPQDLIDTFLIEISRNKSADSIFNRENLLILCLDLFLAGSETTSNTLAWTFICLALYPEWITRLQKDLEKVVGRNRPPCMSDAPSLPRIEAFLAEVQRSHILAPFGIPHRATKDVTLGGYKIPKDTLVLLSYYSVAMDKDHWENPKEFRPQRFLDSNGQFSQKSAAIPFGQGKRRCLGEILARSTLFLFFTYVIHYFDFEISPVHGTPDPNGYDGFSISPKPYYLKLSLRSDLEN
ncbi:methyl farnesoate epoxidase [Cephus cinctus]|uniref:Methyl farnesoate epoxidase n=1 Tax=Cephus cinctus TaxID=211228 RepID=A0AAJ7FM07_CEPCN|nr:methyl farnesoate epoxidase [Cephus cinctus]